MSFNINVRNTLKDRGKHHHAANNLPNHRKRKKFRDISSLVMKLLEQLASKKNPRCDVTLNRKECCWKISLPPSYVGGKEPLDIVKVLLEFDEKLKKWFFSIFSYKGGGWKDTHDVRRESLIETIQDLEGVSLD